MEDRAELKVVLHLLGGRAFIAVQGTDTDPVMEPVPVGTLEEALGAVPGVVEHARERWATSPRNPKYEGPPPPHHQRRHGRQSRPSAGRSPGRGRCASCSKGADTPQGYRLLKAALSGEGGYCRSARPLPQPSGGFW